MKHWFVIVILALFPTWAVRGLVNKMGHSISPGAKVGFSFIACRELKMAKNTRIGHLNFIKVLTVAMHENAHIGTRNVMRGPIDIDLADTGVIGNRNIISRAPLGVTSGPACLRLGALSKITADHTVDCTRSVILGDYTTLAGKGSQIWTHGYVHEESGAGRYRVDGAVTLGNNVYIGTRALITGGVTIADHASVGAGVVVTRDLDEPGFYVSAPLRMLPLPKDPEARADMQRVEDPGLIETVYEKT